MRNIKIFYILALLLISFLIFKSWFSFNLISAGDFWSSFNSMYSNRPFMLYAWNWGSGAGMGGFVGPLLWIYLNFGIPTTIFGKILGLNWNIIERIYYLFPFIVFSILSSSYFFKKIFVNSNYAILSSAIFSFNTYILMVVGGGQVAIALAYSFVPFVLYAFLNTFEKLEDKSFIKIFNNSLLAAILLSLQIIFDLRIAYITLFAILILWILKNIENKNSKFFLKSIISGFIIPGALSFLLNTFWILPTIINRRNPIEDLGQAYSSLAAVKFFSFAKFEDAFSLLHPNWPENIFGKVGFLKPEFLLLPILAFSSLYFISKTKDQRIKSYVLFFALLGLVGAFLAKGANDPFGGIYLWMFKHFPGFLMFRDPTKWYTLIAISYSILIPFSVWKIYGVLSTKYKVQGSKVQLKIQKFIPSLFLLIIIFCLLYLIRPVLFGQLTGTFKPTTIPSDYIKLEQFLSSQNNFSRTLWIPATQRFGFYSNNHPKVTAQDFFKTLDISEISRKVAGSQALLENSSIKYVIVPYDSQGEIFLKDRKYDKEIFQKTINDVKQIPYLKQVSGFEKIAVFEVPNPKDHFYISNQKIIYQYVSPVEYKVSVKNAIRGQSLIFSENYDPKWVASTISGIRYQVFSTKYEGRFNSFALPQDGNYVLDVYYYPQKYVEIGSLVSLVTFITVIFLLILLNRKRNFVSNKRINIR